MANTICLYRGDDRTVSLTVIQTDGTAYSLTGSIVVMYVKQDLADENSEAIITKTGSLQGGGVAYFSLIPSDTNDVDELEDNVPYPVDFQVTTAAGKIYTVLRTQFVIIAK